MNTINNRKNKKIFLLIFFLIFFIFYFKIPVFSKNNQETNLLDEKEKLLELASQGKIRTCLKPSFEGEKPAGSPPIQKTFIRLTGFCGSPSGCTCVRYQGRNYKIDHFFNDEKCQEIEKNKSLCENFKELRSSNDKQKQKLGNKCVSCAHSKADAVDPVLSSLKPIVKNCNIIRNNRLAKNYFNKDNILGETTILPYGQIDVVVEEETARHAENSFYAVGNLPPQQNSSTNDEAAQGNEKSIQIGKIVFNLTDFESPNVETKCVNISWDPFGRVFDANTLEPISDIEVVLIDKNTNQPVVNQFEENFDITGNDGVFNILVEKEGYYKLEVFSNLTDHKLVKNPKINPLWKKIYSDLYVKDSYFFEKPKIATHHDIPLVAEKDNPYHVSQIEIINLEAINLNSTIEYKGRVSYPYALVCLKDEKTNKIVSDCVNADNIGKFSISVNKSKIPHSRLFVDVKRVNLTDPKTYEKINNKFNIVEKNQTIIEENNIKKYYFDPILSVIEGYAYDENRKVIPYAVVNVRLKANDKIFFTVNADKNGFFSISSDKLPFFEYYLEFIDPQKNKKIIKTTSEFVNDNNAYLLSNNINLINNFKLEKKFDNKNDLKNKKNDYFGSTKPTITILEKNKETIEKNFYLFFLIIFILILIAILVFYLILRNNFLKKTSY